MELTIDVRAAEAKGKTCSVIDLAGELDTYSCPAVKEAIVKLVDEGVRCILLNLQDVEYIDSAGLGTLVGGLKRTTEQGGQLKIVNASEQIQKVFNITGLVRVFEQYQSEQEALNSFSE